jgi:hypothetical protein
LFLVGSGVLACLTGCGLFQGEQREPWRDEAEQACVSAGAVRPTAFIEPARAIDGPGVCGMEQPFRVSAFAGGSVTLNQKALLACPIIPVVDSWLADVVQPAAQLYLGTSVTGLKAGSYACRGRNNQRGARLSEHAFGNALDVMAFQLADGREISVKQGWSGGVIEDQEFLREVLVRSCEQYKTVLGPGADLFHYDHFHLDLARHDPRGRRHVCKPVLKFTPRTPADPADGWAAARPSQALSLLPQGDLDAPK